MSIKARVFTILTAIGLGVAGFGAGTAYADPAQISFDPAHTVLTLPAGCVDAEVHVVPTPQGAYHGFLRASCDRVEKIYYVQRDPEGVWALRTTPYQTREDFQLPAVAVDETGTYAVMRDTHGRLILGKRQNNGGFIAPHVLGRNFANPGLVTVIARHGQYWVVWNDVLETENPPQRDGLWESKTIGKAETQVAVGRTFHDQAYLIPHGEANPTLAVFDEIDENDPASGYPGAGRLWQATRHGTAWSGDTTLIPRSVVSASTPSFLTLGTTTYAAADTFCHVDEAYATARRPVVAVSNGDGFRNTELDGPDGVTCAAAAPHSDPIAGATMLKLGDTVWAATDRLAWRITSTPAATALPTVTLSAPPAGTTLMGQFYRSGRIVRLLTTTSDGVQRLSEQQSPVLG